MAELSRALSTVKRLVFKGLELRQRKEEKNYRVREVGPGWWGAVTCQRRGTNMEGWMEWTLSLFHGQSFNCVMQ